jgi:hypothetical protein
MIAGPTGRINVVGPCPSTVWPRSPANRAARIPPAAAPAQCRTTDDGDVCRVAAGRRALAACLRRSLRFLTRAHLSTDRPPTSDRPAARRRRAPHHFACGTPLRAAADEWPRSSPLPGAGRSFSRRFFSARLSSMAPPNNNGDYDDSAARAFAGYGDGRRRNCFLARCASNFARCSAPGTALIGRGRRPSTPIGPFSDPPDSSSAAARTDWIIRRWVCCGLIVALAVVSL